MCIWHILYGSVYCSHMRHKTTPESANGIILFMPSDSICSSRLIMISLIINYKEHDMSPDTYMDKNKHQVSNQKKTTNVKVNV